MLKQFYFKQFILALVRSLNIKTVHFPLIQFSLSTKFGSIWPIDKTLSCATILGLFTATYLTSQQPSILDEDMQDTTGVAGTQS